MARMRQRLRAASPQRVGLRLAWPATVLRQRVELGRRRGGSEHRAAKAEVSLFASVGSRRQLVAAIEFNSDLFVHEGIAETV